ncbi:hypothetical protein [Mucilaginibacter celer]|uniref:Uncharacterized protein n=1 Tax=Mucilaginibacter celer TaxID=2305508 RepID=A0A494VXM0_9SPHI|nr:hypothetical protein [Mucilaginibacter celer]AYL96223.1 hypothetical protein HYN43_013380 [Mucilaginibacter celer]
MERYITVTIVIELLCFVVSVYFLSRDKSPIWKSAIVFLLITVIVEILGRHYNITNQFKKNSQIYNLLTIPECMFISGMFYMCLREYKVSGWLMIAGLALVFGFYLSEIARHGIYDYMNTTTTLMSVVFSFYGFLYLFLLIRGDDYVVLKTHTPFWWITGSLIYYFGGLAVGLLFSVLNLKGHLNSRLYTYIYMALNILMYAFWSYSFRCRYHQRKSNN